MKNHRARCRCPAPLVWLLMGFVGGHGQAGARPHGFPAPAPSHASQPAESPSALASPSPRPPANDRVIDALLADLGPGVDAAFTFVRDRIGLEAYPGSLRGARGTLWSRAGNSLDQADLLLTLLRAQAIDARLARGTLGDTEVRALIRSLFDPTVAGSAVGCIPERFPRADPEHDPALVRWASDHWWVELADGTALDPAFPGLTPGVTPARKTAVLEAIPAGLRHQVVVRLRVEFHNPMSGYTHTTPLEFTFDTAEVYGRPITLGHFIHVHQPPALVTGWKTHTYSPFLLIDDPDGDWTEDRVLRGNDYQEFLTGLFPLANSTLTRLTLEFEVRHPERAPEFRRRDLLDRVGLAARHGLAAPGSLDTRQPALTEFDLTTFLVVPGFLGEDVRPPLQETLRSIGAELDALAPRVAALTNVAPTAWTAGQTEIANRYAHRIRAYLRAGSAILTAEFLHHSDHWLRVLRRTHQTHAYYDSPRLILFESRVRRSGDLASWRLGLDLRRNLVQAIPYPGQNVLSRFSLNLAKGRIDSALEHAVLEDYFPGRPPESGSVAGPFAVLRAATTQSVPLINLRSEADIGLRLETLPLPPDVRARLSEALRAGHQVSVPGRMLPLNGSPAIGWWELDPTTGELAAVGEDGGRQSLMEYGILLSVVAGGSAIVLPTLGDTIVTLLGETRTRAERSQPFNPDFHQGTATGDPLSTRFDLEDGEVAIHADGSATINVGGSLVTLPASAMDNLDGVLRASGPDASRVHYHGLPVEVWFTYAPTLGPRTGRVAQGMGLRLDVGPDPAFDVVHDAAQFPAAYRARITYTGDPAPRDAGPYRDQVGHSFLFELTGLATGNVWGTDVYTWDSPLATAAVHAGLVAPGETATVKVTILPGQASYRGSHRNGVTSRDFGAYDASYRFEPILPALDQALVLLDGTAPAGWNLLFPRETHPVPAGVTNEVSVFLRPDAGLPLPPPATSLPFTLRATRTGPTSGVKARTAPSGPGLTLDLPYIMPEVHGLAVNLDPTDIDTSPRGTAAAQLTLRNSGNVRSDLALLLDPPPGFSLGGLPAILALDPGETLTLSLTFTSHSVETHTEFPCTLRVRFGPADRDLKEVDLRLHVSPPGARQARVAARHAEDLGRKDLGRTFLALSLDLSRLHADPGNDLLRARALADLEAVLGQCNDPILGAFLPALSANLDAMRTAPPASLAAAMEDLGTTLADLADRLEILADHDFEATLHPNSATARPETPATFQLHLRNKGRRTTTYELSLSAVPPGITGGLDRTTLTLAPGEVSAFGLAGTGETASVTLTLPADTLLAFPFAVRVAVADKPAIHRLAHGSFIARPDLVQVLQVETAPPWIDPAPRTTVGTFLGGDEAEGLDLTGDFLYAVNLNASGSQGSAGEAKFTGDDVPGVTVRANTRDDHWQAPQYGDSPADNLLESVMGTTRYSTSDTLPVTIDLAGLEPGRRHRLQLLFSETRSHRRAFDVLVEDRLLLDDFNIALAQGGVDLNDRGVVVAHEFTAHDDTLNVSLDGSRVANPAWTLHSPVLSGLTLEVLPGIQVAARVLNAVNADRDISLEYAVRDPTGTVVHRSPPQTVRLSTRTSLDTVDLGAFVLPTPRSGIHTLEVTPRDAEGLPIPGGAGHGTFLVGTPITATWKVTPDTLPPGDPQTSVQLSLASTLVPHDGGLTLIGLADTPGTAMTLAVSGNHAYVGGSEEVTVLDLTHPRDPRIVHRFASGPRGTAIAGSRLLVRHALDLEVYELADPVHPHRVGSAASGLQHLLVPDLRATPDLALLTTLVIGYATDTGDVELVRGDLLAFDLRHAAAPQSLGLLFNTPHTTIPEWPGSDSFLGLQSAIHGDILLLPGSTAPGTAEGGLGRLVLIDLATPGSLAVAGDFILPETRVLLALATQDDRALVLGDTGPLGPFGRQFSGNLTASLLDLAHPRSPRALGSVVLSNATERVYYGSGALRVTPGPPGVFLITGVEADGQPAMLLADTTPAPDIRVRTFPLTADVTDAVVRSNLLVTTSVDGLAVHDLGGLVGLPVVVRVTVPRTADTTVAAGSFVPPPDAILPGAEADTLVWHVTLSASHPHEGVTWTTDLRALQPGEARPVCLTGEVEFSSWGAGTTLPLPPLQVTGAQILSLEPSRQTRRPGAPADFDLHLRNPATHPVTYDLAVQGVPGDWVSLDGTIDVPPAGEATPRLRLVSREDAPRGDHDFAVIARSGDLTGMVQGTLTLEGTPQAVVPIHGLVLSLHPPQVAAARGTPATVNVRLTNTGQVTESCTLTVTAEPGVSHALHPPVLDVPPGLDNYRETAVLLQPASGLAVGPTPFTVTATSDAAIAVAQGVLEVLPPDFALTVTPATGEPDTPFTLRLRNHGLGIEAFALQAAGPLAPVATLDPETLAVAPGEEALSVVTLTASEFALPGSLPLTLVAQAHSDPRARAAASAVVAIPPHRALLAWFHPVRQGRLTPGPLVATVTIRNAGNLEEACRLEITPIEGAVSPRWQTLAGGTDTVLPSLRLPAQSQGVLALEADLTDFGTSRVGVRVQSVTDPDVQAEAIVLFQTGVVLSLDHAAGPGQTASRLHFGPLPEYRHTVEYRNAFAPDAPWEDLPGGPHNSGQILDPEALSERYYRVRLEPE